MKQKLPSAREAKKYFHDKVCFSTGPAELYQQIKQHDPSINIIDVRSGNDFEKGHIPHACSLPMNKWSTMQGLQKDKVNIVYCYHEDCHLAAKAALQFAEKGFPVMELDGGWASWQQGHFDVET